MGQSINTQLAIFFRDMYNRKKEEGENYIPQGSVAKKVLIDLYEKFVSEKVILPIEALPMEENKAWCMNAGKPATGLPMKAW